MRLLAIALLLVVGCNPPTPNNVLPTFEEIPVDIVEPTPQEFDKGDTIEATKIDFYTADDCLYCDLAKEDGVVNCLQEKFAVEVEVHRDKQPAGHPYLIVRVNGKSHKLDVYYDGYMFEDDPNGKDQRLILLCGRVAHTIRELQGE